MRIQVIVGDEQKSYYCPTPAKVKSPLFLANSSKRVPLANGVVVGDIKGLTRSSLGRS
jgi:hypothetical protein